ncbi:hypothetical protein EV426DRAFT_612015 [Tirmania nivea]|nr:hypothetical protein EV426DRAFT_612015 [Tirmania nivea]
MAPNKHSNKRNTPAWLNALKNKYCQAITRNNKRCISIATNVTGKTTFCVEHASEYRIFYSRYKELQSELEGLKFPEIPSVGGTGRIMKTPAILSCKDKTILDLLKQYYRRRKYLLKRNIDARKWFMNHFHSADQDRGHKRAVESLQEERAHITEILFAIEMQLHSLRLPERIQEHLRKWQSSVKDQVIQRVLDMTKDSNCMQRAKGIRPMENITMNIAPPEAEADPLEAEQTARRHGLLEDFKYFLRYRFDADRESFLDLIGVSECIFRRILLATPGALELALSHSTIRSFLEDDTINIDILQELWDLMMQPPTKLVWDAISDYRTFVNVQFEQYRDVPEDEKIFLVGGYINLPGFTDVPSESPQISWYYLYLLSSSCVVGEFWALSRSFKEAMVLYQLLETVQMKEWEEFWTMVHESSGRDRRNICAACALYDILVRLDHGPPYSDIRYGINSETNFPTWSEYQARPLVFFQMGIDDPHALLLIEEFKVSRHAHRIWAKNAKTGEIVCAPENPQEWTNRARRALRRESLERTPFTVLATLADSLSWAEERAASATGGANLANKSSPYRDHYDVLVVGTREDYNIRSLLLDIWRKAAVLRGYWALMPQEDTTNDRLVQLFESHPFISLSWPKSSEARTTSETKSWQVDNSVPSLARRTRWPKEADEYLACCEALSQKEQVDSDSFSATGINWSRSIRHSEFLIRMLEEQGIFELDNTYPVDMKVPVGAAFALPEQSGLYIDVTGRLIFLLDGSFIRPWKSEFPPDDALLHRAASYLTDNPTASFTLFILSSGAVHWPFKFHTAMPYWFSGGADTTRIYTSRYMLKDPPGSEAAVHGYMSFTFSEVLRDCTVWRDMIVCMRPTREEKITLRPGLEPRIQGSLELAQDLVGIGEESDRLWNESESRNLPGYDKRKFKSMLKFEVHGPLDFKGLKELLDVAMTRLWE